MSGMYGVREPESRPPVAGPLAWLADRRPRLGRGLGSINPETRSLKCLFVADGQPWSLVTDALVANTAEKTSSIVMVFERPLEPT